MSKPKIPPALPEPTQHRLYDVEVALLYLCTSRFTFYKRVGRGEIQIVKTGKRTQVTGAEIIRLTSGASEQVAA